MNNWDVVCVSSKGQMVIPRKIREGLHIMDGEKLKITVTENAFIVKKFPDEHQELVQAAKNIREGAKKKRFKKSDLKRIIDDARKTRVGARS